MRVILLAGALFAAASTLTFAAKITVDPNAGPAPAPAADEEGLARKITCDGGCRRLSAVCQEIRKMTGIRISCGQSPADWRVRDIPVAVYARDVSAGAMLKAIAVSVHAQFLRTKVAGEDEKDYSYTIFRTRKGWDEIAAPENARRQSARDRAKWAWDALVACARLPEAAMPTSVGAYDWGNARLVGSLLASLGTATRDRVLDGEILRLPVDSGAASQLYNAIWDKWQSPNRNSTAPRPNARPAYIKLSYSDRGFHLNSGLRLCVAGFPMRQYGQATYLLTGWQATSFEGTCWTADIHALAYRLADQKVEGIPAPPPHLGRYEPFKANPVKPPEDDTFPGPPFTPLATDEDWNVPELKAKVTLLLPENRREVTFADVICQVAKSGGLNLACEDFRTHKDTNFIRMRLDFGKDVTVAEVLRGVEGVRWFLDREDRMLVGWERDWPEHHSLLAPERVFSNLSAAMTGRGADLDDVVPLLLFNSPQRTEWLEESREFSHIDVREGDYFRPLWWLYDSLSSNQRKLARSESGFPLGALPRSRVDEFVSRLAAAFEDYIPYPISDDSEQGVSFARAMAALSGPTDAVLKVSSKPVKRLRVRVIESAERSFGTLVDAPPGVEKRSYSICLESGRGDEAFRLGPGQWQDGNFPILASDRQMLLDTVARRRAGRPAHE